MNKRDTLNRLQAELDRWEGLLQGLTEAQITAPDLPENWSIKDVMAHLRAWQQRSIARIEAARDGREPIFPEWPADLDPEPEGPPDAANAWLQQANQSKPWPQAHQEWRDGFRRFIALGEALPEADLLEPGKYPWLEGEPLLMVYEWSLEHHQEHWGWLQDALQARGR